MSGPVTIGLVASRALRSGPDSPLFRFIRSFAPFFTDVLDAHLCVVGATLNTLRAEGLLRGHRNLEPLPAAAAGGIITLVAKLVGPDDRGPGIDWVIYLLDPTDLISLFPETQALKRQCVVNDRPFLSTEAAASEWCTLEWVRAAAEGRAAFTPDLAALVRTWVRPGLLAGETLGLIAHDRLKPDLLDFARRNRPVLSRFGRRLATGTTGSLLNGVVPPRLSGGDFGALAAAMAAPDGAEPWVSALRSGPRGGDAQIAQEVVLGHCRRVVFFEDPHVAREHEADIQLLERATRFAAGGCLCLNSAGTAQRWVDNLAVALERMPRRATV